MVADQELVLGLGGAFVTILAGAFGFTHKRIAQVRDEARQDLDDLQQQLTERLKEGQNDRTQMRAEMLGFHERASRQHEDILVRLGQVATRDEIKGDLGNLKAEFQHLENRIAQALRTQDSPPRRQ